MLVYARAWAFALGLAAATTAAAQEPSAFAQARTGVRTAVQYESSERRAMPAPQDGLERVSYRSEAGRLGAYLTPDPGDGVRRPAIIWMRSGQTNSAGDVWSMQPREYDETARAFRNAGIVMMFPSLRGGNDNPGKIEGLFGEIDDVLAAADYLAAQPQVDPKRIDLGGHGAGGTLVLLVAAATNRFRAVFSFGPVARAASYGRGFIPFDFSNAPALEERLRAPVEWMNSVRTPLFVIEGAGFSNSPRRSFEPSEVLRPDANARALGTLVGELRALRAASSNPNIRFLEVAEASHFSVLAPANGVIARAILADTGTETSIALTAEDIARAHGPRLSITPATFLTTPTAEQFAALYPVRALERDQSGHVMLSCTVRVDGRLDCVVASENPTGWGFGEASLRLAQYFRMRPRVENGVPVEGGRIRVPIRWLAPEPAPEEQ